MTTQRDAEDRRQQRLRRLGTKTPICVGCGESDPAVLDLHHIAGRAHHDDVAILCANCHRKESDKQRDHCSVPSPAAESASAKLGHYLMGLGDLMCEVGPTLREFGTRLIKESKRSD